MKPAPDVDDVGRGVKRRKGNEQDGPRPPRTRLLVPALALFMQRRNALRAFSLARGPPLPPVSDAKRCCTLSSQSSAQVASGAAPHESMQSSREPCSRESQVSSSVSPSLAHSSPSSLAAASQSVEQVSGGGGAQRFDLHAALGCDRGESAP